MTLSEAEIRAIVQGAVDGDEPSAEPPWAVEVRRMLIALADFKFRPGRATPLVKLCEAGARYGWRDLERAIHPNFLNHVSPKARASLTRDLRRSLERLTQPCLELERTSFGLALNAINALAGPAEPELAERIFLADEPSHRLFLLFKTFPVLARLWCQLIFHWRGHITEVLARCAQDRDALSRAFLGGQPAGIIVDFRCNLSDPHRSGRTVMQLRFKAGAVIYKPRPGDGEWEWNSLLEWLNAHSFRPRLRTGRVLRRKGYCWMDRIEAAPCNKGAATRRFYERIGGMIAVAYLLKAVDCHRDNLIAAGEDPVLVDAETLWHVSRATVAQTPLDFLSRTGFFPDSIARSLRSRSSVLSRTAIAQHRREIINGFNKAWRCMLRTKEQRRSFARRLWRIQARKRRWLYRATEKYAAIKQVSIRPAALRSGVERRWLITRLCKRSGVASEVIEAEIDALKDLDIPYFVRSARVQTAVDPAVMPANVRKALRRVLA